MFGVSFLCATVLHSSIKPYYHNYGSCFSFQYWSLGVLPFWLVLICPSSPFLHLVPYTCFQAMPSSGCHLSVTSPFFKTESMEWCLFVCLFVCVCVCVLRKVSDCDLFMRLQGCVCERERKRTRTQSYPVLNSGLLSFITFKREFDCSRTNTSHFCAIADDNSVVDIAFMHTVCVCVCVCKDLQRHCVCDVGLRKRIKGNNCAHLVSFTNRPARGTTAPTV